MIRNCFRSVIVNIDVIVNLSLLVAAVIAPFFFWGGGGGWGCGVWLVGRLVGWLVVLTYFTMVRESVGLSF